MFSLIKYIIHSLFVNVSTHLNNNDFFTRFNFKKHVYLSMLQVTIGVFGHEEEVISKPITPAEMKSMIYRLCQPHDICQAVLQQELVISIGKIISTTPELFDGILKIRIGSVWVMTVNKKF